MKQKKNKHRPNWQQRENAAIRKDLYKRLLYIFLGIIVAIPSAGLNWPQRGIAIAGFLFALYHLVILIGLSQSIIDSFFPPKTNIEITTKPINRFMYYFASSFFFVSLVFEVLEIKTIDNTINGMKLFWMAACAGIFMAILLTIILKKLNPSVYYESSRRYTVHFGLFVGCFLLFTASASFINHFFASKTITCKTYTITSKSIGGKRNKSSWLFIKTANGNEERFDVTRRLYNNVNAGGNIILCTKKGKLGYEVVIEFKPVGINGEY